MDLARHHAAALMEADRVAAHFGWNTPDGNESRRLIRGLGIAVLQQRTADAGHLGDEATRIALNVALAGSAIARRAVR
jgi:hypothetical protein